MIIFSVDLNMKEDKKKTFAERVFKRKLVMTNEIQKEITIAKMS